MFSQDRMVYSEYIISNMSYHTVLPYGYSVPVSYRTNECFETTNTTVQVNTKQRKMFSDLLDYELFRLLQELIGSWWTS